MAVFTLLESVNRSAEYPITANVSVTYNCATITLELTDDWTQQMLMELPSINFKIYKNDGSVYSAFDVNMDTFEIDSNKGIKASSSYSIPIYDIPKTSKFSITPNFDNNAISSHNNLIETGIEEGELWETETTEFPIKIKCDNDNIASGGGSNGGGGGGATDASSVSYDNSASGLTATNVQDALDEIVASQQRVTKTDTTVTILSSDWSNDEYVITDQDITATSDIYLDVPCNITDEQYDAIAIANIVCSSQSAGSVTIKATGIVPTIDVPLKLTIITIS